LIFLSASPNWTVTLTGMWAHRARRNRSAESTCTGCHRRGHRCRRHIGWSGSPVAPDTAACCRCDSGRSRRGNCQGCRTDASVAWCPRRRCASRSTIPTRMTTGRVHCLLLLRLPNFDPSLASVAANWQLHLGAYCAVLWQMKGPGYLLPVHFLNRMLCSMCRRMLDSH